MSKEVNYKYSSGHRGKLLWLISCDKADQSYDTIKMQIRKVSSIESREVVAVKTTSNDRWNGQPGFEGYNLIPCYKVRCYEGGSNSTSIKVFEDELVDTDNLEEVLSKLIKDRVVSFAIKEQKREDKYNTPDEE